MNLANLLSLAMAVIGAAALPATPAVPQAPVKNANAPLSSYPSLDSVPVGSAGAGFDAVVPSSMWNVPAGTSSFVGEQLGKPPVSPPVSAVPAVSNSTLLAPGDVFGLVTLSNNPYVNGETVVIYQDGTLGIKEPNGPGYLFQSVLLEDYGLLIAPEPLTTVKVNENQVLYLNASLYNPSPIFYEDDWLLRTDNGQTVVCPSWNSVLAYAEDGEPLPCTDAVAVDLAIVPIDVCPGH